MLGCRASSDLAKLINSSVVSLCCCLGQLGFRGAAVTSVLGGAQLAVPGHGWSQQSARLPPPCPSSLGGRGEASREIRRPSCVETASRLSRAAEC